MSFKHLTLVAALALAAPAYAITVNVTDFTYGGAPSDVFIESPTLPPSAPRFPLAGQFTGTLTDNASQAVSFRFATADAVSSTSFTAYCAELTQEFFLGTDYEYTPTTGLAYFSDPAKVDALSRLFTANQSLVHDANTSAAMQAAIWEIIYETGTTYDLGAGGFEISSVQASSEFAAVNTVLANLDDYSPLYRIDMLTNPDTQDFLIGTAAVPEPGTWALLVAGLGVVGFMARRRKA